jgi:bacillolysin
MPGSLHDLRWHVTRDAEMARPTRTVYVGGGGGGGGPMGIAVGDADAAPVEAIEEEISFNTDEAAARYYLDQLLGRDDRPALRALTAPDEPKVVPDLRLVETYDVTTSRTKVLRFQQFQRQIPIFGTRAVVELDEQRHARSVGAELAEVGDVAPIATISPSDAVTRLATLLKTPVAAPADLAPPTLTYFKDVGGNSWNLAYLFLGVPGCLRPKAPDHGMAPSPRSASPRLNCVLEATGGGALLFQYGADPSLADVPVECHGFDEVNQNVKFWGRAVDGSYRLEDAQRKALTYDLQFGDLATAPAPTDAISSPKTDWGDLHRAAISAHYNAARVLDFYNTVLHRDGVDGRSMPLVSLVNCLYGPAGADRSWANAVWYKDRMWYGQKVDAGLGRLASYSRFLDVIAHELTHGVTEYTSKLVYQGESGALNESFSDIFGIIIGNWDRHTDDGGSVDTWSWQIGKGLAVGGGPLRDFQNPTALSMPDHMDEYLATTADYGGVHTNSNIHNKAAYNVLTAVDATGTRVFTPFEVASYYYWTLERLNDQATFVKTLQELIDVVSSNHPDDAPTRSRMVDAIITAYGAVGIAQ